jgi:hypothetical protein
VEADLMPNSRRRKIRKAGPGSRRSGDPRLASLDALAAARYDNAKNLLVGMLAGGVPGESLVPMMLMTLWVLRAAESGAPPNVCADACQTLRYAFAQFGIDTQLVAVDLVVDDPARGTTVHGTPEPSWEGTVLDGHCILWLPRWRRFLDPTVTQYADAARLGFGPVMGRMDAINGSQDEVKAIAEGEALPEGAHFAVPRGAGMLLYTVASREATRIITDSPWMVQNTDDHRRTGINLASYALDALRRPSVISIARAAPFPRVTGLLAAIGDAPSETDAAGNWYFTLPDPAGGQHRLRLDEISLPGERPYLPLAGGAGAARARQVHRGVASLADEDLRRVAGSAGGRAAAADRGRLAVAARLLFG